MFPNVSGKVSITLYGGSFWCSVSAESSRLETLQSRKSQFLLLLNSSALGKNDCREDEVLRLLNPLGF